MKGKKKDIEFITKFISKSVIQGLDTPELMVNKAKKMVAKIDEQIIRAEKKKELRAKLLDVISNFEKAEIKSKLEDEKLFSFLKIQDRKNAEIICNSAENGIKINNLKCQCNESDLCFLIKQMIELKIISKVGDCLVRGDAFKEFDDYTGKR